MYVAFCFIVKPRHADDAMILWEESPSPSGDVKPSHQRHQTNQLEQNRDAKFLFLYRPRNASTYQWDNIAFMISGSIVACLEGIYSRAWRLIAT